MKKTKDILYIVISFLLIMLATFAIWYVINEFIVIPNIAKQLRQMPRDIFIKNWNNPNKMAEIAMGFYKFGFIAKLLLIIGDGILFLLVGFLLERRHLGSFWLFAGFVTVLVVVFNLNAIFSLEILTRVLWSLLSIAADFIGFYCGKYIFRKRWNYQN